MYLSVNTFVNEKYEFNAWNEFKWIKMNECKGMNVKECYAMHKFYIRLIVILSFRNAQAPASTQVDPSSVVSSGQ